MRRIPVVALALISLGAAPVPTPTPAPGATPTSSDPRVSVDALFKDYDRTDTPGCALGIFRDGRVLYSKGYGMANLELAAAITPQTVFDIGSVSKQFTAFSIHLLASEGKLSLDDDIRKWVPELPDYGKKVTIRHLLHHTGGLPDYIGLLQLQGLLVEDVSNETDAVRLLSTQKTPYFAPGEKYEYSNTGFTLLSVVVERASGKSLRDFAAERIFGPLGMRHTQINETHNRIIPDRATGYRKAEAGGFEIDMSDWEQIGDGGVLTTVEDLQRWDENFYTPVVGDRALVDAMQQVGVLNNGKKQTYASGLRIAPYRGLDTVGHGGSWAGYRAQILRFPQQHFAVACLCNNGGTANPGQIVERIADIYLGSLMQPAQAKPETKTDAVRYGISVQELKRLAGAYRNTDSGQVVELGVLADKLGGQLGRRKFTLEPTGPGRFRMTGVRGDRTEVSFSDGGSGARPRMEMKTDYGDDEVERETWEPVTLWKPTASDVAGLAGVYVCEPVMAIWRFSAEGDKLFFDRRGQSRAALSPTTTDTFSVDGLSLKFQRDAAKKPTGFTLDSGETKGIAFVRLP